MPYLSANTTPWQLEGVIAHAALGGLRGPGRGAQQHRRDRPVQGREAQQARAALRGVLRPRAVQLPARGHHLGALRAEGRDARARQGLPRRHPHPRVLHREEHRASADGEVPHLHDHDRRDEERVRRAAQHAAALHAHVDPRDARGPARDPAGDPPGALRGDGRHAGGQRSRTTHDGAGASST